MIKRGFSLIEVLIASLIFTVVMITATSVFLASSRAQIKTQLSRDLIEQSRFAMETITRDIRTATGYKIISNFQIELTMTDGAKVVYGVEQSGIPTSAVTVSRDGGTTKTRLTDPTRVYALTNFTTGTVLDTSALAQKIQPFVHIQLYASSPNPDPTRPETQGTYKLETTVSLRNYVKGY